MSLNDDGAAPAGKTLDECQTAFLNKLHRTKLEQLFPFHALLQATGENLNLTDKKSRLLTYGTFIDYFVAPLENNEDLLKEYDFDNFNDFVVKLRRKSTKRTLFFWKEKGPLSKHYDDKITHLENKIFTSLDVDPIKLHRWKGKVEGLRQAQDEILTPFYSSLLAKRFASFGETMPVPKG